MSSKRALEISAAAASAHAPQSTATALGVPSAASAKLPLSTPTDGATTDASAKAPSATATKMVLLPATAILAAIQDLTGAVRQNTDELRRLDQKVDDQATETSCAMESLSSRLVTMVGQALGDKRPREEDNAQTPLSPTPSDVTPSPTGRKSRVDHSKPLAQTVPKAERAWILAQVDFLAGSNDELSIPKVLKDHIVPVDPFRYGNVTRGTIDLWKRQAREAAADRAAEPEETAKDDELDANILASLDKMASCGILTSVGQAYKWCVGEEYATVAAQKHRLDDTHPIVSRSRVARVMKANDFMKKLTGASKRPKITPEYFNKLKATLKFEIAYLMLRYNIPPELIFNLDETCYRIVPDMDSTYSRPGVTANENAPAFRKLFEKSAHTTVLCGVSATNDFLPPQVNWKGATDRLKTNASTGVLEHVQHTHWSTDESLMAFIDRAIIPRWEVAVASSTSTVAPQFMVLLDSSTVHTSASFRKKFQERYAGKGVFCFIPPNATSQLQPLDVAVFAGFKQSAVTKHIEMLTTGVYQHLAKANPGRFQMPSAKTRSCAIKAIEYAWSRAQVAARKADGSLAQSWAELLPTDVEASGQLATRQLVEDDAIRAVRGARRPRMSDPPIMFPMGHPVNGSVVPLPMHQDDVVEPVEPMPSGVDSDTDSDADLEVP